MREVTVKDVEAARRVFEAVIEIVEARRGRRPCRIRVAADVANALDAQFQELVVRMFVAVVPPMTNDEQAVLGRYIDRLRQGGQHVRH